MDNPDTFTNFLGRIGIPNARSRGAFTNVFGETFDSIIDISKSDLNNYLSNNMRSDQLLALNQIITFGQQHVFHIHAVGQILAERKMCNALEVPNIADILNNISAQDCRTFKKEFEEYEKHKKLRKDAKLPDKVVSTDKGTWFENKLAIEDALQRQIGVRELPLSYAIRPNDTNDYDGFYASKEDKLINCAGHNGPEFKDDNERVYSLLTDYVTDVSDKTVIEKYKVSKNGRKTWLELCLTMESPEYLSNLAVQAEKMMRDVIYKGEKGTFGIKKYHQIISQAFNMLSEAHNPNQGRDTRLSESQKITRFMSRIKENDCAKTCLEAEKELRKKPIQDQTFNNWYADMLGSLSKYRTMVQSDSVTRSFNVNSVGAVLHNPLSTTSGRTGRGGRGRGRGRGGRNNGRGRGRGRGRGHGRGRGNDQMPASSHSFNPLPLRNYSNEEWQQLSYDQKQIIKHMKIANGWINQSTPPNGYYIDEQGVARKRQTTRNVALVDSDTDNFNMPPPPNHDTPPIPPTITTDPNSAGAAFSRTRSWQSGTGDQQSVSSTIATVTANGRNYIASNNPLFDANGRCMN